MDLLYSASNIMTLLNAFDDAPSSEKSPPRISQRRRRRTRTVPQPEAGAPDDVAPIEASPNDVAPDDAVPNDVEELPEPQAPDRPESPSDDEMCCADETVGDEAPIIHPSFTRDHLADSSTLETFAGNIRFRRYGVLSSIYRAEYKLTLRREYAFMYSSGVIIIPTVFVYDTYNISGQNYNKVGLNIQVVTIDKRIAEINHTYLNKVLVGSHVVMIGRGLKVKVAVEEGVMVRYITKGTAAPTREPLITQSVNHALVNNCTMMIVKNGSACLICELICNLTGKSMVISKPNVNRVRFGDVDLLFNCTGLIGV